MTEELERDLARQICCEIAARLKLAADDYSIKHYYGSRLTINCHDWDCTCTIVFWKGQVKADIGCARSWGGVYGTRSVELTYDAADPRFLDKIVARVERQLEKGPDD
jgi:hypothetical protein